MSRLQTNMVSSTETEVTSFESDCEGQVSVGTICGIVEIATVKLQETPLRERFYYP